MKRNNWLVPGLAFIGLALIVFSIWSPQGKSWSLTGHSSNIAKIIEVRGTPAVHSSDSPVATTLQKDTSLKALDTVTTDDNSEAVIEFSNGGQLRILEKSEVLIDRLENSQPLAVLRSGQLQIESFGKSPSFWVRDDGQLYSATDYALVDHKNAPQLSSAVADAAQNNNKEQISQVEIESTLNAKKSDFFKCYGQLIQKTPQASGQVLLSFTISKNGNTSKIEVAKSDLNEESFKTCLTEVVARTRFRSFTGSPVTTVFPLRFE